MKPIVPIFFATDNTYLPILDVALTSLIQNASKDYDYVINVINTGLDEEKCNIIKRLENEKNINVNGAVVISLDQQYISGPGMAVIAPYENNRNGNSDALALAVSTGFDELGFLVSDIQCGKIGYKELEDGTVVEKIPTESEEAINANNDTSCVTICFGTNNTNPELVGKAIKLSLARYINYLSNENSFSDLIYRKEVGDSIENVASITGNSISNIIKSFNWRKFYLFSFFYFFTLKIIFS